MHWKHGWRSWLIVLLTVMLTSPAVIGIGTPVHAAASDEADWRRAVVKVERPREGGLPAEVGSGFFVSPAGHILTAAHVLLESDESDEVVRRRPLNVQLFGTPLSRSARVLAMNRFTDLALLKIKADGGTPFLPMGDSEGVRSGDLLTIIGHPLGRQDWNVSAAIVDSMTPQERIFLQATLFSGQSGGPALDREGRVVGIASYREEQAQQSYLVPSKDALGLLAGYVAPMASSGGRTPSTEPTAQAATPDAPPGGSTSDRITDGTLLAELREDQPEWIISGDNYNLVDSQLSAEGLFAAYVGDSSWDNYAVEFDLKYLAQDVDRFSVLIRRQSDTDYVGLQLRGKWTGCNPCPRRGSRWVVAKGSEEMVVVGSTIEHDYAGHYRIEVNGSRYTFFKDGNQMFVFNNGTFAKGGVGLNSLSKGITFTIGDFKVVALE